MENTNNYDLSTYKLSDKQIILCKNCNFTNNTRCHLFSSKRFLYYKYNWSLVYHNLKFLNEIIDNNSSKNSLIYFEIMLLYEDEIYFKRYYKVKDISRKMDLIIKYYKFNDQKPCLFIKNYGILIENYNIKTFKVKVKLLYNERKINTKIDNTIISSIKSDNKTNSFDFKNISELKNILNIEYINIKKFKKCLKNDLTINNITKIYEKNSKNKIEETLRYIVSKINSNKDNWRFKPIIKNFKKIKLKLKSNKKKLIKKIRNNFNNININILFNNKKKSLINIKKKNNSKLKQSNLKSIKSINRDKPIKKNFSHDFKKLKKSISTNNSLVCSDLFKKNKSISNLNKTYKSFRLKNKLNNLNKKLVSTNIKNLFIKKKKKKILTNK